LKLIDSAWLVIKGFCMGMADLVPGVSGGTMAFILGIYERLLAAIRSFDKPWLVAVFRFDLAVIIKRPHFTFIIPLVAGIFAALFFFTHVIPLPVLIRESPELVYGLFFGLILGSIIVLMGELKGFGPGDAMTLVLGIVVGLIIVNMVPLQTPNAAWFIFVAGAIAICAMILPGISGSFLLLLMHKYSTLLTAIGELDLSILVPFALGCIAGLVSFSRLLGWLLSHFYQQTLLVIKGILIASLWVIWPFQERVYETLVGKERLVSSLPQWPVRFDDTVIGSLGLMLIGLAIVLSIHALSRREA
jgi:putative membrane protein